MTRYHCKKCGHYYDTKAGTIKVSLDGKQTNVKKIICASCKEKQK